MELVLVAAFAAISIANSAALLTQSRTIAKMKRLAHSHYTPVESPSFLIDFDGLADAVPSNAPHSYPFAGAVRK